MVKNVSKNSFHQKDLKYTMDGIHPSSLVKITPKINCLPGLESTATSQLQCCVHAVTLFAGFNKIYLFY